MNKSLGSTQPGVPLSTTVPLHACHRPSEILDLSRSTTLLCPLAPSRIHGQVTAFFKPLNNLPLTSRPISLLSFLTILLRVVCTISTSSLRGCCSADPSLPLGQQDGLRFPACLAVRCVHILQFWPGGCESKRASHFQCSPKPPAHAPCMPPGAGLMQMRLKKAQAEMVDLPDRRVRVSESF